MCVLLKMVTQVYTLKEMQFEVPFVCKESIYI